MKSLIRQKLGHKIFNNYVPAGSDDAKALADAVLPGEYEILELVGQSGNENVSGGYKKYTVMLKDDTSHKSTYLNIVVSQAKTSTDIRSALTGKTFNGVKADRVIVLNEIIYDVASSGDNGNSSSGG